MVQGSLTREPWICYLPVGNRFSRISHRVSIPLCGACLVFKDTYFSYNIAPECKPAYHFIWHSVKKEQSVPKQKHMEPGLDILRVLWSPMCCFLSRLKDDSISLLFFLAILGIELMALCLGGRCCTTGAILPVLFALVIFKIGFHFFPRSAWTVILQCYASCHSWDDGGTPPYPAFSFEMGFCDLFIYLLPRFAWNLDPLNLSFLCSLRWPAWSHHT
jgi:hypothetical protein